MVQKTQPLPNRQKRSMETNPKNVPHNNSHKLRRTRQIPELQNTIMAKKPERLQHGRTQKRAHQKI